MAHPIYPFHTPGQPTKTRMAHLAGMRCPALIIKVTRDTFGTQEEGAGYTLSPAIEILWMPAGVHDLAPRK